MASLDKLTPESEETGEIVVSGACSPTITFQGERSDCLLHTLSKLLIKNVFEKVLDLKLNEDEETEYDKCMPLTIPARPRGFEGKCSEKGYIKIMLFYYLFSLIEISNSRNIEQAIALLTMPETIEFVRGPRTNTYRQVNIINIPLFRKVKVEFLEKSRHLKWKHIHISMDDVDFESIKRGFLEPILGLNLYIEMGLVEVMPEVLTDDESEEVSPGRHIVLITGFDEETVHIKNTWSYPVLLKIPWREFIKLDDGKGWRITDLHTILPIKERVNYDVRNIDKLFPFIAEYSLPFKGGRTRRRKSKRRTYRT
uniref:Uncharacterized protein n=1 Tax=viral metagenome TaxID=1070528 RepID=A0A6C0I0C3_9ZZZZ